MTTEPDPLTGKLVAQETTLPCGCVIKLVRTIESFKDALERDLLDDFHPELTFCPLHDAAELLRDVCLEVKKGMDNVVRVVFGTATKTKEEPHDD